MALGAQIGTSRCEDSPKRSLWDWLGDVSRAPALGIFMLLAGLIYAAWLAPLHRDEFVIVQGGELALVALLRLLVHGHTIWFFRGLVILGLGIPFVCGLTSPIYWSGGLRWEALLRDIFHWSHPRFDLFISWLSRSFLHI